MIPPEPAATHAARLADVSEAPLTPFASQPLQLLALLPPHPLTVAQHGPLMLRRFVRPSPIGAALGLWDVGP